MPALDPNRLSRNELVQLVNSTPLGAVLTRSRLDEQMNRAGRRWHDGRYIRLVDYVRWLAEEADRPPEPKADSRAADLVRKNAATWRAQDIAPIPEVEDPRRRGRACTDFRLFCETYFPTAFCRAWSNDHLRVIAKIEEAVLRGGASQFPAPGPRRHPGGRDSGRGNGPRRHAGVADGTPGAVHGAYQRCSIDHHAPG